LTRGITGLIQIDNFILMFQALLDVYTIKREIGTLDGIKLGLVGDLANGRTVRSLAYLIAKYQNIKIYFVSPDVVKMKVLTLVKINVSLPFLFSL
jgi:aspartate carbamoyltransferase catalytic subunit